VEPVIIMTLLGHFGVTELRIEGGKLVLEDRDGSAAMAVDSDRVRKIAAELNAWARKEEQRERDDLAAEESIGAGR
jgi:hypothetical protein